MAKGHVGRPTNEEVAARKRKKMLKYGSICAVVIAAIFAFNRAGITNLMGNSSCNYVCEEGWERNGATCYKETVATSDVDAYLVGDVINDYGEMKADGKVTLQDWTVIKNAIDNNEQLTEEQKIVYDLNGDGEVNSVDVVGYSTSTNGQFVFNTKYACPAQKVNTQTAKGTSGNYEYNIITTTSYTPSSATQTKCIETTTRRIEKKAYCETVSEVKPAEQGSQNINEQGNDQESAEEEKKEQEKQNTPTTQPEGQIEKETCTYNSTTKEFTCGQGENLDVNNAIVSDTDDDLDEEGELQSDTSIEYDDENGNEDNVATVLEKKSNYLKYAYDNSNEYKIGFTTLDSKTGVFSPINGRVRICKDALCSSVITLAGLKHQQENVFTIKIFKNKNVISPVVMDSNHINLLSLEYFDYVRNKVDNEGSVDVYLQLIPASGNYKVTNPTQKITVKKGQTTVPKINFNVTAPKYAKIKIDFGKQHASITNQGKIDYTYNKKNYDVFPAGYSNKVLIGKPAKAEKSKLLTGISYNKKTYKLVGFNIYKPDGSYLCYRTAKHNSNDFVWGKTCSHGKILLLADRTNELASYLTDTTTYTLKAMWKKDTVDIRLKNSVTNKAYLRYAQLQLYNTKQGCLNQTNADKFGKVYSQPKLNANNTGKIKISNTLAAGKTYYLRLKISKYYNETKSPQCVAIKATTKTKDISLVPRHFEVKYKKGDDELKGTLANSPGGKYTDKAVKLRTKSEAESAFGASKKNKTFSYWAVSRDVTVKGKLVTQYKGFASEKAKKNKDYSWTTKENCKKYGYKQYKGGSMMNVNTYEPGRNLVMHARWENAKSGNKKSIPEKPKSTTAKTFKVKYRKGNVDSVGGVTGADLPDGVKTVGKCTKLRSPNSWKPKQNGIEFDFWVATRKHNGVQQYWIKESNGEKKWKNATGYSQVKDKVVKYKKTSELCINHPGDGNSITLHAHWKKTGTANITNYMTVADDNKPGATVTKTYTVKYSKGADAVGGVTGADLPDGVKIVGQCTGLRSPNGWKPNKKGYKFSFWVATRKLNGAKQYWCQNSNGTKQWVYSNDYKTVKNIAVKYKKTAQLCLDSPGDGNSITLHAHWEK